MNLLTGSRFFPVAVFRDQRIRNVSRGAKPRSRRSIGLVWRLPILVLASVLVVLSQGMAQERKTKLPGLDKITGGPSQQAFSGIVQSLDMKRKILNVNTVQGGVTEIFPIRKGVPVMTARGDKLKLTALVPGTNVIIYYEQKGDRRTMKQIVVLAAAPSDEKKLPPSS